MRGIGKLKYLDELMRLLETKPDKLRIQIVYTYSASFTHSPFLSSTQNISLTESSKPFLPSISVDLHVTALA